MAEHYILAINPGSTSMKMAVYQDEKLKEKYQKSYTAEELAPYEKISDQLDLRYQSVREFLVGLPSEITLSAVVGRGGVIVPVQSGAYRVNELMMDRLQNRPLGQHASNLGGILAYRVAESFGIPAYVYDGVTVNEFEPLAFLTGHKEVIRLSRCHALNMRAMAIRAAKEAGSSYQRMNQIVVHMGGGITLSAHRQGRMVDIVLDSEGPFSPERGGRIPVTPLLRYAVAKGLDPATLIRQTRGSGGLVSLLGTNDAREVERRIGEGDQLALLAYETMAYQTAKAVGELATVLEGKVDQIVLTGAIAYSQMFVDWLRRRIGFLGRVVVIPGEDELEALSLGVLRVLRGEEEEHVYTPELDQWDEKDMIDKALKEFADKKKGG